VALAALLAAATAACGSSKGTSAGAGTTPAGTGATGTATAPAASGAPVSTHIAAAPSAWTSERLKKALTAHGGTSRQAKATTGNARVGAIFNQDVSGDHFCTASVVHSTGKNLLATAAHCVHGGKNGSFKSDLVFVPEYRDGAAPQGQWPVTGITVDQRWIDSSDPDLDVAFVKVGAVGGKNIEDVLGGNTLGVDLGFNRVVQITGYPADAGTPISCFNTTSQQSQFQMKIDCTGYPGGTSGSPWLTAYNRTTRTGTLIGVIGGYQEGGATEDTSYSCYFDTDVQNLYNRAVAGTG
jgi:V8-like Glu-specific endopeptidase